MGEQKRMLSWAQDLKKKSIYLGRYNSKIKGLLNFQIFVPKRGCFL